MRVLDLFSGIGGFHLGLTATGGFETVAFCEIAEFPKKILAQNYPNIPIYDDVKEITHARFIRDNIEPIDLICGGFPCTDISQVGKQAGIGKETRSGLWSECFRLLSEFRPKYGLFENTTALLSGNNGGWFEQVLWDIHKIGYDAEWHCISASAFPNANHHRDRVWIIAYPRSKRLQRRKKARIFGKGRAHWHKLLARCVLSFGEISDVDPIFSRGNDGTPNYKHRIEALGNSVCPPIVEIIGRAILEAEKNAAK